MLGLAVAMFMHAVRNGLVLLVLVLRFGLEATANVYSLGLDQDLPAEIKTTVAVAGLLAFLSNYVFTAVFFLAIGLWLRYQRRVIREELAKEVDSGLISRREEITPLYCGIGCCCTGGCCDRTRPSSGIP